MLPVEPSKIIVVSSEVPPNRAAPAPTPAQNAIASANTHEEPAPLVQKGVADISAKKKKKKKKPAAGSTQLMLDSVLLLDPAQFQCKPKAQLPSLCAQLNALGLVPKELSLIEKMLHDWPLSSKLCLMDLIGADIFRHLEILKEKVPAQIPVLNPFRLWFSLHYFDAYLNICMKSSLVPALQGFAKALELLERLRQKEPQFARAHSQTAKERLRMASQGNIPTFFDHLVQKVNMLQNLIAKPAMRAFLLDIGLAAFQERDLVEAPLNNRKAALLDYIQFTDGLLSDLTSQGRLSVSTKAFQQVGSALASLVAGRKPLERVHQHYVRASLEASQLKIQLQDSLGQAIQDPSFTYAHYCKMSGIIGLSSYSQEEFIAYLRKNLSTMQIFNLWLEDIYDVLARHIFPEIESHYRPSGAYINRIAFCFEFLSKHLAKTDLPKGPEAPSFYDRIALFAEERVEKHFSPQWERFSNICWPNWLSYLQQQAGNKFSLCNWMMTFHAFYEIGKLSQPYFAGLSAIKEIIFTEISQAEDRPNIPASELQTNLKSALSKALLPPAIMTMALEDTITLFEGGQLWDIGHLLPDVFVDLCTLSGWEARFPQPAPALPLVEEPVIVIPPSLKPAPKPPLAPSAPPALPARPKEIIPSRQEFLAATKRRLIMDFLSAAGFVFDRYTNDTHALLRHPTRRATALVPLDVGDTGTRLSIYRRAFETPAADHKSDDDFVENKSSKPTKKKKD